MKSEDIFTKQDFDKLRQDVINVAEKSDMCNLYPDLHKFKFVDSLCGLMHTIELGRHYVTKEEIEKIKNKTIEDIISRLKDNIVLYERETKEIIADLKKL